MRWVCVSVCVVTSHIHLFFPLVCWVTELHVQYSSNTKKLHNVFAVTSQTWGSSSCRHICKPLLYCSVQLQHRQRLHSSCNSEKWWWAPTEPETASAFLFLRREKPPHVENKERRSLRKLQTLFLAFSWLLWFQWFFLQHMQSVALMAWYFSFGNASAWINDWLIIVCKHSLTKAGASGSRV